MEDGEFIAQLVELNRGRAAFYRRLAYYYLHELTQEQIDALACQDFSGLDFGDETLATGYRQIAGALNKVNTGTREQLACDYAHTFLAAGNYETFAATPFESVFTSEEGLLMQDARDEVYKMYCAEHVQPNEELHIPEDHVSFEFEFLATMLERMNEGLAAGNFEQAAYYAQVVGTFHAEHQLNWIDDLCDTIEDVAETAFYCGIAKVTRGFVHLETQVISDEADAIAELRGVPAQARG